MSCMRLLIGFDPPIPELGGLAAFCFKNWSLNLQSIRCL